jgi:glycosyltransferase involved in cell wall biosynthesis
MRILYFSRDYTTHDYRFLSTIAQSSEQAYYLRLEKDPNRYEQRPLPDGVRELSWAGGVREVRTVEDYLDLMPSFETVIAQVRPDIIHAGPVPSCGFMTALSGFEPFIVMSWGSDLLVDAKRNKALGWISKFTLDHARLLLCDNSEVRDAAFEIAGVQSSRVVSFPWGIDLDRFKPGPDILRLRQRPGWEDASIILCTRSWEPVYGIDVALDSFFRAYSRNRRLRLVLCGNGSLAPAVRRFIAEHAMQDLIFLPGRVPQEDLPNLYRAVDIYLSCAHSDGTSVSLLEAMAHGLPVIVTDRRSNAEWVNQGVNGWLAEPGNADSFAAAILQSVSISSERRRDIATANLLVTAERADWEQNSKLLLKAYRDLVQMHSSLGLRESSVSSVELPNE